MEILNDAGSNDRQGNLIAATVDPEPNNELMNAQVDSQQQ
jgi:hypothetical protein